MIVEKLFENGVNKMPINKVVIPRFECKAWETMMVSYHAFPDAEFIEIINRIKMIGDYPMITEIEIETSIAISGCGGDSVMIKKEH